MSLTLIAGVVIALSLSVVAQAARKATPAQRRALAAAALPRTGPYAGGGRIGWAEISTAGPYALVFLAAKPGHQSTFQPVLRMLRRHGRHWRVVADILYQDCPGVPARVLADFRHFFATQKPKFLSPGPSAGCAGRIAHAGR